jgi:O-antigen/teichoic acid export membrane protein
MLARKSTFVLVSDISNALLSYVALYIIARYMSPGAYGIISFAIGYIALMTIYGDLGFDSAHIKYISSGENQTQCTSVYFIVKALLSIIGIVSVVLSVVFWKFALTKGFESADNEFIIYIILASTIIKGLAAPFLGVFAAQREVAKYKLSSLFGTVSRLAGVLVVGLLHLGTIMFAFVYVIEALVLFGIAAFFFFKSHRIVLPEKKYFKMYSSFATPMAFVGFFSVGISSFSPVLIQLCFSSTDVGYFSAALRVVGVIGIFTGALGALLFPTLSAMHADGDSEGMRSIIYESERYISMITFPLICCAIALSTPIVYIMLAGWLPAAPILLFLPIYTLFAALEQPYLAQLLGSNNPNIVRNKLFAQFCINIGLNILLVPQVLFGTRLLGLGGVGAAIALVASSCVGWIYCRVMALRILPGVRFNKHLLIHLSASLTMGGIAYYLTTVLTVDRWFYLGIVGAVYFAGYFSILIAVREFTKKDFDLFLSVANIKKLFLYAKEEVKK